MEYIQANRYFDTPGYMRWSHDEYPVSYYAENVGETKFWDGGQCEILEEGTYNGEGEGEEGWGVITWNNIDNNNDVVVPSVCEADDHDRQIAMALSEEDAHMDEERAKTRSDVIAAPEEDPQQQPLGNSHHEASDCVADADLLRQRELAKRFSDSAPHVPRVNAEIPFSCSQDKQRLSDRISYYGLAERQVAGDGNCQFRALSDQLYRTPDRHMLVRSQVVAQLAEYPNSYSSYVPMDYNKYLENMTRDGEWGDHVTLQAAADFYGMKISLITSFKDTCFIEIVPAQQKSQQGLYLSFWSEIHYNSIDLREGEGDANVTNEEDEEWVTLDD